MLIPAHHVNHKKEREKERKPIKSMMTFWWHRGVAVVAFVSWILLCSVVTPASAQPFAGFPVMTFTVFPQAPKEWDEADLRVQLGATLSNRYRAVFGSLNATADLYFFNQVYNPFGNTISVAMNPAKYNNGVQLFHFDLLASLLQSGAALASEGYTVSNAVVAENAAPSVTVSFPPFGTMYAGAGAKPLLTVRLNFSPRRGRTVTIALQASAGILGVTTSPATIVVAYPAQTGTFQLLSNTVGLANFTAAVAGGTDGALRYIINSTSLENNWAEFIQPGLAQLIITPPTTKTYASTISDNFTIQVPSSYLYDTFSLSIALRGSPLGLTIRPAVLVVTSKQPTTYNFSVSGPVGSYTIGATLTGANGADFGLQPRTPCFVDPTLNITVSRLLDAFMITPYYSVDYGGAYSSEITVRIRRPPKYQLIFSVEADDSYAVPSSLEFLPNSSTAATFVLVAKSTGIKIVSFALSGPSAGDYEAPPARSWAVRTPNMLCSSHGGGHRDDCLSLNGCRWNEALRQCSNRTLPIHISDIPIVFNHEPKFLEILLPTPVVRNLTIILTAKARLAFSPKRLYIGPGEKNASFSFVPKLKRFDATVQQEYFLKLLGPDANVFSQQQAYVIIRPQIVCKVTGPWSFYVVTGSGTFNVSCDTPADSTTTMELVLRETGRASPFVFTPSTLTFLSGQSSATFSVPHSAAAGLFHVVYNIGGVDAPRYAKITDTPIKAQGSIRVCVPPAFYVTGGILSPVYNLDLSMIPSKPVTVTLTILNASTGAVVPASAVAVIPLNITYNGTQRGTFQVIGLVPGQYLLNTSLEGDLLSKYDIPEPTPFAIQDPEDGSAFTSRLGVGFLPSARCRVNVGRNSAFFQGQNFPDDGIKLCTDYIQTFPNSTFNCAALATKLLCRTILQTTGNLCIWHNDACVFIQQLQGNVTDVAFGSTFTLLLTKNKTVWSIGSPLYGQLGHYSSSIAPVPINANITAIVAGTAHSLALDETGAVWAWGNNRDNQLGIGTSIKATHIPRLLVFPRDTVTNLKPNITCITAGTLFSGALSLSGNVFLWGSNALGQLSWDPENVKTVINPAFVDSRIFGGASVIGLQCGEYHTMVATETNVYTFGDNAMGQLGRDWVRGRGPLGPNLEERLFFYEPLPPMPFNSSQPFISAPTYNTTLVGRFGCVKQKI